MQLRHLLSLFSCLCSLDLVEGPPPPDRGEPASIVLLRPYLSLSEDREGHLSWRDTHPLLLDLALIAVNHCLCSLTNRGNTCIFFA